MQVLDRVKRMIEAPWSPDQCFLPRRNTPELSGNSPEAFRQTVSSDKQKRLFEVIESEQQTALSRWSQLYTFSVPAPDCCSTIAGGQILHLSDVHFLKGDPRPLIEVASLIKHIKATQTCPDLIVLTGDVITKMPDDLCSTALRLLNELSELSAQALFVYGNHDYHGKVPEYISKTLEHVGFKNLTGSTVKCSLGNGYAVLNGIDDAYFGTPKVPHSIRDEDFNITLVHNLDAIRKNFPPAIDLILSGHTHWGELKVPFAAPVRPLNGMWWMEKWGYTDNLNRHTRHWDQLSTRTLSFVHPGLARYYVPRLLAHPPGFVMHNFTPPVAKVSPDLPVGNLTKGFQI